MESTEVKRFGRYEVVAELGRGAMGVVYKARDPQIDRLVAVKTVSLWGQEPEEEQEFRLRFGNEAQAAGRLHHPGIISVFDVGEDPDNQDPYIVLEYVSGESLQRVLAREKKLALSKALKLAEELAEALDYAHAQGVVHRDIKPANILVTEDGHAKIADFGIAKLNLAHFTIPGKVLGTPAYMAPEQLSGEGADGRSDLFSLGVILYVMVTGHSPFPGSSATTVCFKVANREPVAASALDMTLPPQIDAVIARAIAKNPDERYQNGAELAQDLRLLQQAYKPGATTARRGAVHPLQGPDSRLNSGSSHSGCASRDRCAIETVRECPEICRCDSGRGDPEQQQHKAGSSAARSSSCCRRVPATRSRRCTGAQGSPSGSSSEGAASDSGSPRIPSALRNARFGSATSVQGRHPFCLHRRQDRFDAAIARSG